MGGEQGFLLKNFIFLWPLYLQYVQNVLTNPLNFKDISRALAKWQPIYLFHFYLYLTLYLSLIQVTRFPTHHKILQSPDEKLNKVYEARVCTTKTVYATILVKPQGPSIGNGGYSPQDIILQACTGSSVGTDEESQILNPQDTSAQSSDIYGAVVVHVPNEQNEDIQQAATDDQKDNNPSLSFSGETWNKGGMSPTLVTLHDLDATESNSVRPLMLHTERNPNGQLMLSSLIFQLQSDTGDEVSPLPSERKPLLSDLVDNKMEGPSLASLQSFDISDWSDSGCDDSTINTPTIYSPAQANFHQVCLNTPFCDAMFESGYKQNWMPEMLLVTAGKDNCEYKKNYPWLVTKRRSMMRMVTTEERRDQNPFFWEVGCYQFNNSSPLYKPELAFSHLPAHFLSLDWQCKDKLKLSFHVKICSNPDLSWTKNLPWTFKYSGVFIY